MFDGYDSCSEDTSSSSSSDESEEEVAPLPSSLPIIKNNGQVYTYPDGKSGMGKYVLCECKELDIDGFLPVLGCEGPIPNVGFNWKETKRLGLVGFGRGNCLGSVKLK